jgi:Domain of unknown function (DUF4180)
MTASSFELNGVHILEVPLQGPVLKTGGDAVEIVSLALEHAATLVLIPVERLGDDFFDLQTRIAGEIAQKFVTYDRRVAILGDISHRIAKSRSLAAFVAESNHGRDLWFVTDLDELAKRLSDSGAES